MLTTLAASVARMKSGNQNYLTSLLLACQRMNSRMRFAYPGYHS